MNLKIFASEITDTRGIEALLDQRQMHYQVIRESMASAEARESFRTRSQQYGWHQLPMVFEGEHFIGGEPELRTWITHVSELDKTTLWLSLLGLLPFLLGTVASIVQPGSLLAALLPYYGWVILCFMAGTLWGLGRDVPYMRLFSVVFALLAWPGMVFLSPAISPLVQAALFIALLPFDHALLRRGAITKAYWQLRLLITLCVIICQAILLAWMYLQWV